MTSDEHQDILVCPETGLRIRHCALDEAADLTSNEPLVPRRSAAQPPVGRTPTVMLREDHQGA